ncbi:putative non-LTR retroelement reverse transcriptase [Cucumis melo var. makuwa]|uniref:Non-LTR retroelement reverse transcriptase n=1 Tax=Cucumis melo var. makuwa TaxID=1194695 RepID=A0A5A7SYD9_CUCMM|nr:putative non-LTR retroelement reverse transcriptase [Cucumis melo var. makuwa]TYK30943.1 putative non-LTR retroelement reverse transcriptase [Cucumis melo var. makuwa]
MECTHALQTPTGHEEVRTVLFSMESGKTPGLDDFFCGPTWNVVGEHFLMLFFISLTLVIFPHGINANTITLIPKHCGAEWMKDFRPILCLRFWQIGIAASVTSLISIMINGTLEEFFLGKKRLRQGDTLSLFLIVMVMNRPHKSFQFHQCCGKFVELLGLVSNLGKSSMFVARIDSEAATLLADSMSFALGHLLVCYLGLPLLSAWVKVYVLKKGRCGLLIVGWVDLGDFGLTYPSMIDERAYLIEGGVDLGRALCDLGTWINLMPLSIFKKLGIGKAQWTKMALKFADRSIACVPRARLKMYWSRWDYWKEEVSVELFSSKEFIEEEYPKLFWKKSIIGSDTWKFESLDMQTKGNRKNKSLVEESLELELKPLPTHLKYEYLRESDTLSIIISAQLNVVTEKTLLKILKCQKKAIGWILRKFNV